MWLEVSGAAGSGGGTLLEPPLLDELFIVLILEDQALDVLRDLLRHRHQLHIGVVLRLEVTSVARIEPQRADRLATEGEGEINRERSIRHDSAMDQRIKSHEQRAAVLGEEATCSS